MSSERPGDSPKPQRPKPAPRQRPLAPELPNAPASRVIRPRPVYDDDAVIVPQMPSSVFAPRRAADRRAWYATLGFRRTIIPILLTLGVILPLLGAMWFYLDPDSPLKELGVRSAVILLVTGPVLLALAIVNMIQVRREINVRK